MACEFLYNEIQSVALNTPVTFRTSIPCTKGYVYHEGETGNFILKGKVNNPTTCFAYCTCGKWRSKTYKSCNFHTAGG